MVYRYTILTPSKTNLKGAVMAQIGMDNLPLNHEGDLRRTYAVIRFTRDVRFPRFGMAAGERWGFVVYGKTRAMLEAIRAGDRFEFAGGLGLPGDAEILYEGDCGGEYAIAAGHVIARPAQA